MPTYTIHVQYTRRLEFPGRRLPVKLALGPARVTTGDGTEQVFTSGPSKVVSMYAICREHAGSVSAAVGVDDLIADWSSKANRVLT